MEEWGWHKSLWPVSVVGVAQGREGAAAHWNRDISIEQGQYISAQMHIEQKTSLRTILWAILILWAQALEIPTRRFVLA